MTNFNDYWKKKAAKRKKTWTAKNERFTTDHTVLEQIRSKVFQPIDYDKRGFDADAFAFSYFKASNPLAQWNQGVFSLSEPALRKALEAEGADLQSFKMEVSKTSIQGKEAPEPKITDYGKYEWGTSFTNKVFEFEPKYHAWLKRVYKVCTDMELITLNYREVTMTIKRYTMPDMAFAYYEVNPCVQLMKTPLLIGETVFAYIDVAFLLMDMAAEWELRQEEFSYYAKALKLRAMEAVTIESIDFELWDEKKLQKKIQEYIKKEYDLDQIIEQVSRPWKSAVKKYIDAVTERSLGDKLNTFERFSIRSSRLSGFAEEVLQPYLASVNLQDVEIEVSGKYKNNLTLKYQGFQSRLISNYDGIFLFPNSYYEKCSLQLLVMTSLSVVSDYLKVMPAANQKMDETILKVLHIYNEQMMQNPEYRAAVEHLEPLQVQYAGKPVGKMMKYLRWRANDLLRRPYHSWLFPISTIKILSDRSFCYQLNYNGITVERWLDAECRTVYASDPAIEDVEARKAALSPTGYPREDLWSMTIENFVQWFTYPGFLSFDFIDQKL